MGRVTIRAIEYLKEDLRLKEEDERVLSFGVVLESVFVVESERVVRGKESESDESSSLLLLLWLSLAEKETVKEVKKKKRSMHSETEENRAIGKRLVRLRRVRVFVGLYLYTSKFKV